MDALREPNELKSSAVECASKRAYLKIWLKSLDQANRRAHQAFLTLGGGDFHLPN
jgi:hypothetical protein